MAKDLFSFNVKLLAGVTHMRPEKPNRVARPDGMDGWILNRTVEGMGRIQGGAQDILAAPGDMILFPPGVAHLYGHEARAGRWVHQWAYFFPRESWLEWMTWPLLPLGMLRVQLENKSWEKSGLLFQSAIELSQNSGHLQFERAMNRIEELLLHCALANPNRKNPGLDPRLEASIRRMETSLSKKHSLESLAKEVSLSKSRFSHLFREKLGRSPMEYLEDLRIKRAKEFLFISSKTLADVAEECGFQGVSYFSRVFSKAVKIPPGRFRDKMLRKPIAGRRSTRQR